MGLRHPAQAFMHTLVLRQRSASPNQRFLNVIWGVKTQNEFLPPQVFASGYYRVQLAVRLQSEPMGTASPSGRTAVTHSGSRRLPAWDGAFPEAAKYP